MDIELPNGTVIQGVPEGTTKDQVMAKAIKAGLAKPEDFGQTTKSVVAPSGFMQGLTDPLYGAAQMVGKVLEQVPENITVMGRPVAASARAFSEKVIPQREQQYQEQRAAAGQDGFDTGRLVGNVVNPANLVGGVRAAPVIAGAIQGTLQPVTSTDNFTTEKLGQAAIGAVGGKLGEAVATGAAKVLNPIASKAEQTMRELGVQPTVGQVMGGSMRKAEDFAQNLPLIGEAVRNARERALFDFNKGVINKALDKVGDKLPENVVGRDAVAYAAEQVSNKYDDVLSKMGFTLDFKTTSGILDTLNKANLPSAAEKETALNILNSVALSRFDKPNLTGAEYKAIESDLRKEVGKYLNSPTASDRNIGEALKGALDVFKKELYAQNPKMTPQLRRIDSAYGDLGIMERAAAAGNAKNGVFTPSNYQSAVRQADITRNKRAYARGTARGQDVSEAAMETIGKDSAATLEGRYALQNLGGAATAMLASPLVAAAYTKPGQQVVDTLIRQRPELARQLGTALQQQAPLVGGLFGGPVTQENFR